MKCWRCSRDIADGSARCESCGADQLRTETVTEIGRAMRTLYDRYGSQEVFSNSAYLVNGLSDLSSDSKGLRNQLKMALDAGIGRVYLQQLIIGQPDHPFDSQVQYLLTEQAGLSNKVAAEIAGYFDEMIGWNKPEIPTTSNLSNNSLRRNATAEINRSSQFGLMEEIDRKNLRSQEQSPTASKVIKKTGNKARFYSYEIASIFCIIFITIIQSYYINIIQSETSIIDYMVNGFMIFPLAMSFTESKDKLRTGITWKAFIPMILALVVIGYASWLGLSGYNSMNKWGYPWRKWSRHIFIMDAILLAATIPLFIQMIRHRVLEKKKASQQEVIRS